MINSFLSGPWRATAIISVLITASNTAPSRSAAATTSPGIRVGVVAALPAEGQCLIRQKLPPGSSITLAGALQLQLAGMGAERAHRAARHLLSAGAEALVSWGIAGGLAPLLKAGTLLLPESVQTASGRIYPTDRRWQHALIQCVEGNLPLSCAALYQAEAVIASPQKKAEIYHQTRCVAVDMESAAIAGLAAEARVPFVIIRAVADPDHATLPGSALQALDLNGRLQPIAFMASLLRHPQDLFGLWSLSGYFRAARTTLRALAARAGHTLLAP